MRILCVGISHKTADVALRELLSFDDGRTASALEDLLARWPGGQFAILSTCNRTELYVARPVHGHPRTEEIHRWLGQFQNLPLETYVDCLYTLTDAQAAAHLFAVTAGLDSLVPGEAQIVQQVKQAYQVAAEAGTAAGALHELFQAALHVAKHVRTETDIAQGRVSLASVAADWADERFGSISGRTVLAIGAGKMSDLMLSRLLERGVARVVIASRTRPVADALAARLGAEVIDTDQLPQSLVEADVVLCSTSSPAPVVTRRMIHDAQTRRHGRELLIIDIAVPRDVEPAAATCPGVTLYNIDDLDRVVRRTLAVRRDQDELARLTIDAHVKELLDSLRVRDLAPTLDALYARLEAIAEEELQDARQKFAAHADCQEDVRVLERTMRRTLRRLLHPAARNLRSAAGTELGRVHAAALRELFELDVPAPRPATLPEPAGGSQPGKGHRI